MANRLEKKLKHNIIKAHKSLWDRGKIKKIAKKGRYDVWFTLINDVERGEAYWIRYTILCPKTTFLLDEAKSLDENIDAMKGSRGTLWFGFFKEGAPSENFMVKKVYPLSIVEVSKELAGDDYLFVKINGSKLTLTGMQGEFEVSSGKKVAWNLNFSHFVEPFFPIPGIAKTIGVTTTFVNCTHPNFRLNGTITVDGKAKEINNAPTNQMHTYGLEYVDEKIWLHCHLFKDEPEAWLEFGYKDGLGLLGFYDGKEFYSLNNVFAMKKFKIAEKGPDKLTLSIKYRKVEIRCIVKVPKEALIGLTYVGPNGTTGYCYNAEIADMNVYFTKKDSNGKIIEEKEFICEKSLSWETHWLEPIEGLRLLGWDDEKV
jgi:hypothetical protein